MYKIKKALKDLKLLMILEKMINIFIFVLMTEFILDFVFICVLKFVYFHKPFVFIFLIHIFGFVLGFFVLIFSIPKTEKIVLKADSLGFKERFITAFELSKNTDFTAIQSLEIEDTIDIAKKTDFRKIYKFNFYKKAVLIGFIFLVLTFICYFVPSPFPQNLEFQRKTTLNIKSASEKIGNALQEMNKENIYNYEDKSNLLKKLDNSIKIKRNEKSVIEEIKNTEIKLKEISDNENQDFESLAKILSENENLEALANNVLDNNVKGIEDSIQDLNNSLNDMNDESIAESFKKASESISSDKNAELSKALKNAGEKISDSAKGTCDIKEAESANNNIKDMLIKQAENNNINKEENIKISQSLSEAEQQLSVKSNQGNSGNLQKNTSNGRGSGHIENDNSEKSNNLNKNETPLKIDSVENNSTAKPENKKVYVDGNADNEISYKKTVSEYKNTAFKDSESYSLSAEDKEVVKKYFSDLK